MKRRKKSPPERSATEAAVLVRGGTVARHGGRVALRIMGVTDAMKLRKALSADYHPGPLLGPPKKPPAKRGLVAKASLKRSVQPGWGRWQRDAQIAVEHLRACGDWRKITQMVQAMARRAERGALIKWFEQFGSFRVSADSLTFRPRKPLPEAGVSAALRHPRSTR